MTANKLRSPARVSVTEIGPGGYDRISRIDAAYRLGAGLDAAAVIDSRYCHVAN
jgi:hypothetical protein